MPKICRRFFQINSKHVPVDIFYTQKKQFSAVGIPEDVTRISDKGFSHFETEEKLYEQINSALRVYHEKIRTSRKVIAYSLGMTTSLCMNRTGEGRWEGYKEWVPNTLKKGCDSYWVRGDNGYGFSINWDVLMEVRDKETEYHDIHDDGSIGHRTEISQRQLIDWTSEREEAFREIANCLVEMVKKIAVVLGDPEKMIGMIESKGKLLEFKE